ncbi:MAG: PadR family transcriptional regulator [Candidatus Bathyarchaeota archaeon]|nr:PadR family transcriptional regulator [Candidatus Bathyarchaeota archaeon]
MSGPQAEYNSVQYIAAKYKYYCEITIKPESRMRIDPQEKTTANWMKEAQKGYIRMGVLILLNKKPAHGYEIMKEIKDRTKGFWSPTAGGVYPVLRNLEKAGYIKGKWQIQRNRKLKVYKITTSGKLILKSAIIKQNEIANNISALFQEFSREVLNVETEAFPMPNITPPLSVFESDKKTESPAELEHERKHLIETMKMTRESLRILNRKIAKINQTKERQKAQETA